jgi:multiphosphoryl transfer protein
MTLRSLVQAAGDVSASRLVGIPASPGIALGPAVVHRPIRSEVERYTVHDHVAEWRRFQSAIAATRSDLIRLRDQTASELGDTEAAIFEAHLGWLEDPALLEATDSRARSAHCNVEVALAEVIEEYACQLELADDPYFQARAVDLRDLSQRLLDHLRGGTPNRGLTLNEPSIVIAQELTPADTMQMDRSKVLAFCTASGGPTAHAAILARSLGIPAVVALGEAVMAITSGLQLAVDGTRGEVIIAPDAALIAQVEAEQQRNFDALQQAHSEAHIPAVTCDGRRVEVVGNIGSLVDAEQVLACGGEGVGLLRTEFLYVDRETAPTEEEQLAHYQAIARVFGPRPLVIRTLDIGGDKPVPYLPLGDEANPFLGCRAIRICLAQPEILKTQLRAILRVGPGFNLKVMFPMISDVVEWRRAIAILAQARDELRAERRPIADHIQVGVMIEVPSAALLADQLAEEVDFFSIGTNDLTQYTLAVDRTNEQVAAMHDALHPAVLRLIKYVIEAAHARQRWVGLCGELAGDPIAAPILLGLELDEFSCSAPSIPALKARLRSLDTVACYDIAHQAITLDSPAAVRRLLGATA